MLRTGHPQPVPLRAIPVSVAMHWRRFGWSNRDCLVGAIGNAFVVHSCREMMAACACLWGSEGSSPERGGQD